MVSPTKTSTAALLLAILLAGGMFVLGKYVERQDFSPVTISVQGRGEVTAVPDIAELTFGADTLRQATAEQAMSVLSTKMNAVMDAVKQQGIEEKDITTQNLSLQPSYDWADGKRIDRGFEANQSLRVKIRDLTKIGQVLTAATSAGANQAGGVSFTIDDPENLQVGAREKAIANAEEKARALALQLGKQLGKLKGFSEGGSGVPVPMPSYAMDQALMRGGAVESIAVPSGEQEVVVTVMMTYELR
ncbi:MAG: SIMPL domain-containing protein [Candidatus Peribacteraceae bacterium]|nr:SIMPL domain-containing protein [Candidatus Peribacteraceae bacterium]